MSRLPRRPTRTQSRRLAYSLSFSVIALIALICLFPCAARADEIPSNPKEYGTVIGIGALLPTLAPLADD